MLVHVTSLLDSNWTQSEQSMFTTDREMAQVRPVAWSTKRDAEDTSSSVWHLADPSSQAKPIPPYALGQKQAASTQSVSQMRFLVREPGFQVGVLVAAYVVLI